MALPSHEKDSSSDSGSENRIKVMLVDDSAIIRGLIARTLENDPEIQIVSSVHNGQMAINAIKNAKPDVIVLDIEMPVMDGITAIPLILKEKPDVRILMCSTLSRRGASISIKALSLGATECVVKPSNNGEVGAKEFQDNLLRLIKTLGKSPSSIRKTAPPSGTTTPAPKPESSFKLRSHALAYTGRPSIVAIGSSTGGPQALLEVMKSLPKIQVPVIITQHMPKTFTALLAEHITNNCGISCHEGEQGMFLQNGHAYIAPGDHHMTFSVENGRIQIVLNQDPPENFCRPSVEPMMRSITEIYGKKVLGVMLTGMGSDGLQGFRKLSEVGGNIIAQDEKTSVVWGMPGAVAMAGLCTEVLPLKEIGPWLQKNVIDI